MNFLRTIYFGKARAIHFFMRRLLLIITLFTTLSAFSQKLERPWATRVIVKTNLINLLAQSPTLTIEKPFSNEFSAEVSFVQGKVNDIFFYDHYNYSGFLVRAKQYFEKLDYAKLCPYMALYIGSLKRNIQSAGDVGIFGLFGYPSRDFSANSIRAGGSAGLTFVGKKKFVIDGLISLGYGKYTKYYKPENFSKDYLDGQFWLSVGYCF